MNTKTEYKTMFADSKFPNDTGWQDRHANAVIKPHEGFESAMVQMLRGWTEYAETVKAKYDSLIGNDYVLGPEWEAIGKGIEGLLNGECGRIDCGTIDGYIRDTLKANGSEVKD
jgi:hypothetical protein